MVAYEPGRYLRYDEMTAFLKACAAEYPSLCALEEIGRSAEGRSVWAVTLSNFASGAAGDKPGYLLDANTHAGEVTGGATALYVIYSLLTGYGVDAAATELLDTRAVYVVPRIAVDGVETYLTTPYLLRSSPRRYPEPNDPPGLYAEDVNGDGMILLMRQVHPDGDYKVDEQDSRVLARRGPADRDGVFYKVYTEGVIRGEWNGLGVPGLRTPWRMDFNRNYPAFWNPEAKQPGAGPYPLSEPETRALADFLLARRNVGAYVSLHTTGGVLLRPPSYGGDDKMSAADLEVFKRVGELCTRLTGCPCKSTYQAFNFPGQEALVKGADDWAYEHYGVQAFTFELWNPDLRSGGQGYAQIGFAGLLAWNDQQVLEKERRLLAWNDTALGGKGFIPWTPFEHPQLGPVEIGGWDWKRSLQNPPEGELLAEEVTKAASFIVQHALCTPRLTVALTASHLGAGLYKVTAALRNTGGLPTNVTEMGITTKRVRPLEVALSGDMLVVSGKETQEISHLEGWATAPGRTARNEAWVDWVVKAAPGAHLSVRAATPRAGTAVAELTLA
ncbi:MAG TPA: M14 family metallopeptidase [Symbiobacteriaceae bacterium]|nr:M14 family metallopeptidase [Symbiobacteriaceae bacterium]